jgi:hypothetical protein
MKKIFSGILLITLVFFGCDSGTNTIPNNSESPNPPGIPNPPNSPGDIGYVDSAFWFKDIYDALMERKVNNTITMETTASTQYVCDAINAQWGTTLTPVAGTESQAANCEYLFKMIDIANNGTISSGTGSYATLQVVDKIAVDSALNTLWASHGNMFVAVGKNKAAYSTDGINWTVSPTELPGLAWHGVTYGNGKFVAVAIDTNKAAYSTNGINWTVSPTELPGPAWESVTYGNAKFVTVSFNNNKAAYSTDGINWTASPIETPGSDQWRSVTYGNGKFVAVGFNNNKAAYSTDGINWNVSPIGTPGSSNQWYSVTYGNGKFVAVGFNNNKAAYPTDGINNNKVAYLTDGINWTVSPTELPGPAWRSVTYGNGKFVAVATYNNKAAYSTDGISWTVSPIGTPGSNQWYSVTYGNDRFVAIGSGKAAYSTDGSNWLNEIMPSNIYALSGVTYGGY